MVLVGNARYGNSTRDVELAAQVLRIPLTHCSLNCGLNACLELCGSHQARCMFLATCYKPCRPGQDRQTGSPTRGIPFRSEAQRCSTREMSDCISHWHVSCTYTACKR